MSSSEIIIIVLLSVFLNSPSGIAEEQDVPTHGTINVLIGSKFGLVAETDTRLSDISGRPVGDAQRLFQIDDRTICMIADFYEDPGPLEPTIENPFPFLTSIPGIMKYYIDNAPQNARANFETKVDLISQSLAFNLEMIAIVHNASGDESHLPSSQLTIAGYDAGSLRVQQVQIRVIASKQAFRAETEKGPEVILGDKLQFFTAGLDDVAKEMLGRIDSPHNDASAAMLLYRKAKEEAVVASVTLEDINEVADKVEFETFKKHSSQVGGEKETAYLRNGHVEKTLLPVVTKPRDSHRNFVMSWNSVAIGDPTVSPARMISVERGILVNIASYEDHVVQDLDRRVFTQSIFVDTFLIYNGGPPAILDSSNIVLNSTLIVGTQVADNDPYVKQIVATFPSLTVRRGN